MSRDERDPYSLLGLRREASASDIARAYRRAARATHPDARPGDSTASDRFKAVTAAYETLRDPDRRAAYDRAHPLVAPRPTPSPHRTAPRPWREVPRWVDGSLEAEDRFVPARPRAGPAVYAGPVRVTGRGVDRPALSPRIGDPLLDLAAEMARSLRVPWFLP